MDREMLGWFLYVAVLAAIGGTIVYFTWLARPWIYDWIWVELVEQTVERMLQERGY